MAKLGQNFLADPNLLAAIVRDAEVRPGDSVLEVGIGEGVLTERLAEAASFVHVIEIDRGLRAGVERIEARPNVKVVWEDALRTDLAALEPPPDRMVANLPYSVATPVILRTLFELPTIASWTVMVQREIADRLRAASGSKAYGSPSVLVQLACDVRLVRPVGPEVFRPRPRVGSAVVRLTRRAAAPSPEVRELVRAGFAHRRKALARSVELVRPGSLAAIRAGLESLGLDPGVRAEALEPAQFERLAAAVADS